MGTKDAAVISRFFLSASSSAAAENHLFLEGDHEVLKEMCSYLVRSLKEQRGRAESCVIFLSHEYLSMMS